MIVKCQSWVSTKCQKKRVLCLLFNRSSWEANWEQHLCWRLRLCCWFCWCLTHSKPMCQRCLLDSLPVPQVKAGQLCPQCTWREGRAKELRIPTSVRIASSVEVLFALVLKPGPAEGNCRSVSSWYTKQLNIAEKEELLGLQELQAKLQQAGGNTPVKVFKSLLMSAVVSNHFSLWESCG